MRIAVAALGLATAVALVACPPAATTTTYRATLNGANQVPPITTSATGTATATLTGTTLTLSGTYSGLSGTPTAAHIHGIASAASPNAPVICSLYWVDGATAGTGTLSASGGASPQCSTFTLSADQIAALNAGNLYVNIHTSANANGEIRGALIKQ